MNFDIVIPEETGSPIWTWTKNLPVEQEALQQLKNISRLPFIHHHVAAMPDVHLGKGATVGSVIATKKAIIPAAVGVDIGCGMVAVKLPLSSNDLPESLATLRNKIEQSIPLGKGGYVKTGYSSAAKDFLDKALPLDIPVFDQDALIKAVHLQLGTLGSGNHFIELCLDENREVWIMLHSGSRGIGANIGSYFIEKAKREMEKWHIHLPDTDLAYLPEGSEYYTSYIRAMSWAQNFAAANRSAMLNQVIDLVSKHIKPFSTYEIVESAINCHHNYISRENHFGENIWITRKGAVRAKLGDLGIIPGSMGAKSYIVRGKGSPQSFCSCSHGAGRVMSRNKAKANYTIDDLITATSGVECRKDEGVIDEIPMAYKDIDAVMAAQSDLVEIVHTLKQVMCIKG